MSRATILVENLMKNPKPAQKWPRSWFHDRFPLVTPNLWSNTLAHPARRPLPLLKGNAPGGGVADTLLVLQVDDVDLVGEHVVAHVKVSRRCSSEPMRLWPLLCLEHVVGRLRASQLRSLPCALLSVACWEADALFPGGRQTHPVGVDVQLGEVDLIHVGKHRDLVGGNFPPWEHTSSSVVRLLSLFPRFFVAFWG